MLPRIYRCDRDIDASFFSNVCCVRLQWTEMVSNDPVLQQIHRHDAASLEPPKPPPQESRLSVYVVGIRSALPELKSSLDKVQDVLGRLAGEGGKEVLQAAMQCESQYAARLKQFGPSSVRHICKGGRQPDWNNKTAFKQKHAKKQVFLFDYW